MQLLRYMPLLLVPFVAIATSAQQATSTQEKRVPGKPIRDPQALTVVQAALTALGGIAVIGQPQSWQIQGQVQGTDSAGKTVSGTITWEMAGSEFRMAANTNVGNQYIVTGHGKPAAVNATSTITLPPYVIRAKFVPALVASLLVSEFQNANYNLIYLGKKNLANESTAVIRTNVSAAGIDPRVTDQIWYFDTTSGLPVRVEYRLPSQRTPAVSMPGAVNLSNYQTVSGVMYPFQIISYYKNKQTGTITLRSINLNSAIPSTDFDAVSTQ